MAEDFATAAARFCSVIEQVGSVSRMRWFAAVEAALSDVYARAVQLPPGGSAESGLGGRMSTDERSELFAALRLKTGNDDRYWQVFDPVEQISVAQSSLADDLAEIYHSLREGLGALRSGAAPDDVMFEWRSSFELHWATHAIGAMSALRVAQRNL
jgi:hypothetical protein